MEANTVKDTCQINTHLASSQQQKGGRSIDCGLIGKSFEAEMQVMVIGRRGMLIEVN